MSTEKNASSSAPASVLPYYLSKLLKKMDIHDAAGFEKFVKGIDLEKYRDAKTGKITAPIPKADWDKIAAGVTANHVEKADKHHAKIPKEHHEAAHAHLSKIAAGMKK